MTPRNGELLIAPTQDFLTGSYLLTKKDNFLTHMQACQLAATLLAGADTHQHIDLPPPCIRKVNLNNLNLESQRNFLNNFFSLE